MKFEYKNEQYTFLDSNGEIVKVGDYYSKASITLQEVKTRRVYDAKIVECSNKALLNKIKELENELDKYKNMKNDFTRPMGCK